MFASKFSRRFKKNDKIGSPCFLSIVFHCRKSKKVKVYTRAIAKVNAPKLFAIKIRNCNSRLLRSHMRLKKNRPYNHWLKSQGHYLLCFSTSKTVVANSVHLRNETRTRYSLKTTTKIPPPNLENKSVSILRSQNTQNTRTPLKTGSEQSVKLLFIGQWNFHPFQMDQPKTSLTSTYLSQNALGKTKLSTYIAAHLTIRVIKLISNSSINIIEYNSRSFLTMISNQKK